MYIFYHRCYLNRGKMAPKWYEFGERSLPEGDQFEKNYDGRLDGEYGHLMMSGTKLLFVKEEGFLRKKYIVTLNLQYDGIDEVIREDKYNLMITEESGDKHEFVTDGLPVSIVKESVQELMKHN